jgi:thymidine phosphorylase
MDAETIGRASLLLGAGRQKVEDTIDFAVGFFGIKKIGESVTKEEPLLLIHARDDQELRSVLPLLENAVELAP